MVLQSGLGCVVGPLRTYFCMVSLGQFVLSGFSCVTFEEKRISQNVSHDIDPHGKAHKKVVFYILGTLTLISSNL